MRTRWLPLAFLLPLSLASGGCEETNDGEGGSGTDSGSSESASSESGSSGNSATAATESGESDSESGVPPETIDRCETRCDNMLQFGCLDADEHEACRLACSSVSEAELEIFISCVDASAMCSQDPDEQRACYANLLDADPVDPSTTGDTPSCTEACSAYLATPCDPPLEGVSSCAEFCASLGPALEDVAVMCLENADGCTLPAECMFPGE